MQNDSQIEIYPARHPLLDKNLISVLSYNILHKDWVTHDRYPFVFENCRSWKYRLPIIRETIASYNADIICLQEIDIQNNTFKSDFGDYLNRLGYDYIIPYCIYKNQSKSVKLPPKRNWGNMTLYNTNKFKCVYQETLNNNTRMLMSLFIDLQSVSICKYCNSKSTIICIYHALFVINLHGTGHPQKHIQRLNEVKKVIERLNECGAIYKNKQQEIKTVRFNSNINAQKHNMRIIICGDFNSPKTGLVDKLLVNKVIDYDKIKINNISKQGQNINSEKRRIRFIFNTKDVGILIGHRGVFINELKNTSKATIIIPKTTAKLRTRIVIVIGVYLQVLKAIQMMIHRLKSVSLLMCIDEENIKCLNMRQIYNIRISSEKLFNSTEKTINISGDIYNTIKLIIKQLFASKSYIITRMEYVPENVKNINNIFSHCYEFRDSYNDGLISYLNNNNNGYKMDDYYDRLRYFPTFGDGRIVAAMDFIYYTSNNIVLKGISQTINDEEMMNKLRAVVDRERRDQKSAIDKYYNDKQMEQGIVSKIWCLPNDKIVSDHLPICAVFIMKDVCHDHKPKRKKCDCCGAMDEMTDDSHLYWLFKEINSF